jgi:hypothetical protein
MEPGQLGIQESCTPTVDGATLSGSLLAEVLNQVKAPTDGEACPIYLAQQHTAASAWKEMPHVAAEQVNRPPNLYRLAMAESMKRFPGSFQHQNYTFPRFM